VVSSVGSAVGDVVEGVVDAVVDTAEDAVNTVIDGIQDGIGIGTEWLCENGGRFLCGVGNVLGGVLDGLLEGVQDILGDVFDVLRDVAGLVGAVLSLDFPRALNELIKLFTDVILGLGLDVIRFVTGGYVVGRIVDAFQRDALRRFVEDLLRERFSGDRLEEIRKFVGLGGGRFGFPLPAQHRVFMLDSANTPLWDWHNRGVIDLYAMAGLLSFGSFQVFRSHTVVRSVSSDGSESLVPVTRWTISRYLDSQGRDRRLRVYAMSDEIVADRLSLSSEKLDQIGVKLSWNDGENFSWFRNYTTHEISTEAELNFTDEIPPEEEEDQLGKYLVEKRLRRGAEDENCNLIALGSFRFFESPSIPGLGHTSGRHIEEGTLDLTVGSGVIYRNQGYEYFTRYVLPHEIGHFLGLRHFGHDGFQNIMWRPRIGLSYLDWGLFSYYLDREPHFTLQDGKNTWRFIVDQLAVCLPGGVIIG
jgi:hypothetical protein